MEVKPIGSYDLYNTRFQLLSPNTEKRLGFAVGNAQHYVQTLRVTSSLFEIVQRGALKNLPAR